MPRRHWKTLTLVAALLMNSLTAPYVIDCDMNGPSFLAYVEQIRAAKAIQYSWITWRAHSNDGVRQAVEAVGTKVRYSPDYLPDLNPIEMAFPNLKTALRNCAARIVKTLIV